MRTNSATWLLVLLLAACCCALLEPLGASACCATAGGGGGGAGGSSAAVGSGGHDGAAGGCGSGSWPSPTPKGPLVTPFPVVVGTTAQQYGTYRTTPWWNKDGCETGPVEDKRLDLRVKSLREFFKRLLLQLPNTA